MWITVKRGGGGARRACLRERLDAVDYRGTSQRTPLGPYRRPISGLTGVLGGWAFFEGRGTPVNQSGMVQGAPRIVQPSTQVMGH